MQRVIITSLLSTLALIAPLPAQDPGFVDLFNGQNLDGWTQRNGTATYRVEGDSIVGKTSEGSPNSFLCTDRLYGDFELKVEVKVDARLNSGVQIRSQSVGDKPEGRVSHLQVELNGEQIIDTRLDQGPMKDRPLEGYIGLQDHGEPNNIKFRNIRIREIGR